MFVIKSVCQRDIHVIPATVTRLVPAYQQDGIPQGVKRIKRPKRSAKVLCDTLLDATNSVKTALAGMFVPMVSASQTTSLHIC